MLVTPIRPGTTVDDPAVVAAAQRLTGALYGRADVTDVVSCWSDPIPQLRSSDGSSALITMRVTGDDAAAAKN